LDKQQQKMDGSTQTTTASSSASQGFGILLFIRRCHNLSVDTVNAVDKAGGAKLW
jgi:hypothetical protein